MPPAIPYFDVILGRFLDGIDAVRSVLRAPASIADLKAKLTDAHALRCEDRLVRRDVEALAVRLLVQAARRDVPEVGVFASDRRSDVAPSLSEIVAWYAKLPAAYRGRLSAETHGAFAEARRIVERARRAS